MFVLIWLWVAIGVCAVSDIRKRQINVWFCVINAMCAIAYRLIANNGDWIGIIAGLILGFIFWMVCIITKESLGKGDALVILMVAVFVGIRTAVNILITAFLLSAMWGIFLLATKRGSLKTTLPFIPFVFVALTIETILYVAI